MMLLVWQSVRLVADGDDGATIALMAILRRENVNA